MGCATRWASQMMWLEGLLDDVEKCEDGVF